MSDEISEFTPTVIETIEPTPCLRFVERDVTLFRLDEYGEREGYASRRVRILQQKWKVHVDGGFGSIRWEWRDVPLENEGTTTGDG